MLPMIRRRNGGMWTDPFESMHRELDRFIGRNLANAEESDLVGVYPVDIREDENHVYVDAELPGFNKDEVQVTLEDGVLRIEAQRKRDQAKGTEHLTERRYTRVSRAFTLPSSVDESKVQANLSDGVLHLTLDRREEVKPRRIEIR